MVLNGEQLFQATRPRVMVLNGEQHFQAMRPSVPRRTASMHGAGGRTSGIVGTGTMVLIHQRAPPAKGDHPQNWRATDPRHQRAPTPQLVKPSLFLNLEFGGHVPEVSSTSRTLASRRSLPRVVLWLVGGCGTADVIAVRFPLVSCPQYGVFWHAILLLSSSSRMVLLIVRNVLWWWSFRTSRIWRLGLCVVQGSARPKPVDHLLNSSSAHMSKEESTRSMFLVDTARTDKPFDGNAVFVGSKCLRLKRSVPPAILLW